MVAVSTLLMVPAIGFTQDKDAEVRTLTGCLSKAEGAHEYKLTTENGATWELHSKTVKLSPHAGHTVTVTGRVRNADMHGAKEKVKDEMKEHGMDKDATEHGHLRVTSVNMVSDSSRNNGPSRRSHEKSSEPSFAPLAKGVLLRRAVRFLQ
jgi:hypothetical protein